MKHNGFSIPYIKFLSTKGAEDSKKIAKLSQVPIKFKNDYVDRYIVEYDDPQYEVIALLISLGIATVLKK